MVCNVNIIIGYYYFITGRYRVLGSTYLHTDSILKAGGKWREQYVYIMYYYKLYSTFIPGEDCHVLEHPMVH